MMPIDLIWMACKWICRRIWRAFFSVSTNFALSLEARQRHTFITGGTGSGKSNTLLHLIRQDLTSEEHASVVVLDPHGKLAQEAAWMKENVLTDRLVYVAPHLSERQRITINPFEARDISEKGLSVQSNQLMSAIEMIVPSFTDHMRALLPPILATLLHRPNSDFTDLVRFMDEERNADLIEYGATKLPYDEHRDFFVSQFHSGLYKASKEGLQNRFQSLLHEPTIKRFLCGKSTVQLEEAIEAGKVIIFNLSVANTGKEPTRAIGQFLMALIQGYTIRRSEDRQSRKTPVFLYADECQYFCSPATEEVLGESRKFGLHLILATQRTEQVGQKVLDAILGNVGTFIAGRNKGKTLNVMAKELEVDPEEIRRLRIGTFCVASLADPAGNKQVPLVRKGQCLMRSEDWQIVRQNQLERYYYDPLPRPEGQTPVEDAQMIATAIEQRQNQQDVLPKGVTPRVGTGQRAAQPPGVALERTHQTLDHWKQMMSQMTAKPLTNSQS